jgi:tRNA pseudouridine55 synthase
MTTSGGLLFVDKPAGLTSHDVVARVRRAARTKRVGHAGTLDPFATGLLVLAVGTATRLLQFIDGEPKVYLAEIAFGAEMDTDDATGRVIRTAARPTHDALHAAMTALTGQISQVPPSFSAKHVQGTRAYEIARRGDHVDIAPSLVTVYRWDVEQQLEERLVARITCSGGTYVRALARDLGRLSDSAAHCSSLRRLSSGPVSVHDAVTLDALSPGAITDGLVPLVNPLRALMPMARHVVQVDERQRLSQGRSVEALKVDENHGENDTIRHVVFLDDHEQVLGIGERATDDAGAVRWQPRVLLDTSALVGEA